MATTNETSNSEFRGIWDRVNKSEAVTSVATEMEAPKPELGGKARKKWGLSDVVLNIAALLGVQVVLTFGVIFLSGANTQEEILALTSSPWLVLGSALSMYLTWIGGMWLTTHTKGAKSFKIDFGVYFKRWDALIGLGLAVGLYGFVLGSQWLFTDVFKFDMSGADNGSVVTSFEGLWFVIIAIGIASIIGPISEEFFFRGFLLRGIIKSFDNHSERLHMEELEDEAKFGYALNRFFQKSKTVIAVILSSVVFGFMHFQGFETFGQWFVVIITGLLGLVFAIVAVKTGRIGPTIFGHIFYNGGTVLLSLLLTT